MPYTIEMKLRVYDDDSSEYIEVAHDKDGLGLVEINSYTKDGRAQPVIMTTEQANKVAIALTTLTGFDNNPE